MCEINNFDNFRMLCIYFDQIKMLGFNSLKFEMLQQRRNIFLLFDELALFKERLLYHKIIVILLISPETSCDSRTHISIYLTI